MVRRPLPQALWPRHDSARLFGVWAGALQSSGAKAWDWWHLVPSPFRHLEGLLLLGSRSSILGGPTGAPAAPSAKAKACFYPRAMNFQFMKKAGEDRHGGGGDEGSESHLWEFRSRFIFIPVIVKAPRESYPIA